MSTTWIRAFVRRRWPLMSLILAPPLVLAGLWVAVYRYIALDLPAPLPDDARAAVVATLRGVVDRGTAGGAAARPEHPALARRLPARGPVIVTVWSGGLRTVRVEGRGETVADAVADAATQLAAAAPLLRLSAAERAAARLQIDVVSARGPLVTSSPTLRSFGLVSGLDGLGARVADREVLMGADELVEQRLFGAKSPVPGVGEFKIGLDFPRAEMLLAVRAELPPGTFGSSARKYFRFRAETFLEQPGGAPLPLVRGLPPGPALSADALYDAAIAGGRYLVAHLAPNGRYVYEVDLHTGQGTDPTDMRAPYSLPRHFGTTYYLAELYRRTKDPLLKEAIERACDHMISLIERGGCAGKTDAGADFTCVVDAGQSRTNMGTAALAVVALAEYRLATGDGRYDTVHRALVEWILDLQKPNGRFVHVYDVKTRTKDLKSELLYFDGEAALALVRSYKVFGDERMIRGAERALDALVGWYDETFAQKFFFGEEHWTCIAAEAAWPELKKDKYREFCSDYAGFLRVQQFRPGETPGQEDLTGAYSVTPFFVPHNTPAGSRTEAMISAYLLTKYHDKPDERIRAQILLAVGYLLNQQIRGAALFSTPAADADGAMTGSAIDRTVRIDYVQHTCSAMLRARDLL